MAQSGNISLAQLPVNTMATVTVLAIGRLEAIRLVSLGFTPGAHIGMAQNYGRGPLIVTVRGTRVALGRVEAAKIVVKRSDQ